VASEFTIQVQGDRELLQVLSSLRERAENLQPAWKLIGAELVTNAERRFETKTDPAGVPWEPWKPRTVWMRAHPGKKHKPAIGDLLRFDGWMQRSLNSEASRDGVIFGMGRKYGPFHETGTRKMVRRGVLLASIEPPTLAPKDRRLVLDILMEHLHG